MKNFTLIALGLLSLPTLAKEPAKAAVTIDPAMLQAFAPLPKVYESKTNAITQAKVELGRALYFEKRLSKNHDVSCNSCHGLSTYGVDGKATSPGHKKKLGGRNSPSVYNAGAHVAQFWDGRAADLEAQAKGPVLNPGEMAMPDAASVEKVLESMPEYVEMFQKAFPNDKKPVSFDNMALAIGAFERGLVTPSRFDAFLQGNATALTDAEKQGLKTFMDAGCTACHMGAGLGGSLYQKLGLVIPWPNQKDLGRFDVTKNEADKMFFRVPSLRNVAKTGPYFHDGSVATLEEAVTLMGKHQLGRTLDATQVKQIVTFLNALTGDLPKAYIQEPKLPKSTPATPKPNPS